MLTQGCLLLTEGESHVTWVMGLSMELRGTNFCNPNKTFKNGDSKILGNFLLHFIRAKKSNGIERWLHQRPFAVTSLRIGGQRHNFNFLFPFLVRLLPQAYH